MAKFVMTAGAVTLSNDLTQAEVNRFAAFAVARYKDPITGADQSAANAVRDFFRATYNGMKANVIAYELEQRHIAVTAPTPIVSTEDP